MNAVAVYRLVMIGPEEECQDDQKSTKFVESAGNALQQNGSQEPLQS